ncbi:MAG: hypothetical protein HQL69_23355 [Magnetococcales bacterium]|nr:hypothetical protein [Magnetococcales bacterium]
MLRLLDKAAHKAKALVIFFAVSLMLVQALQFHLHFYDHHHAAAEYDTHQSFAHSSYTSSDFEHHNETVTVELSDQLSNRSTALKSLYSMAFTVILLVVFSLLVSRKSKILSTTVVSVFPPKRYILGPPLRAPPIF